MQLPHNDFKSALAAGKLQIGLWCSLCSAVAVDIVSDSGFDWLLLDTEHAPLEVSGLLPLLHAASRGTAAPVVRPAWNDTVLIKRVLDLGAQTILLPYVQDADEARRAVASTRYPPAGLRGVTGTSRAARYGRVKDYLAKADTELCVLLQVETKSALDQLEAIASVEGVDGVFIGPADLAASLGHIGNPAHPAVQDAIQNAARRLKAVGKPAGILTTNEQDARRYIDWGYLFVAVGMDTGLLGGNADRLAKVFKG